MKILGFHHVSINVSDLERGARFYAALGLQEIPSLGAGLRWFRVGQGELHLIAVGHPLSRSERGSDAHFAIDCDDIEEAARRVSQQGGELLHAPRQRPHDGSWYLFALDPDGNRFEVTQHQPAAR